MDRTLYRRTRHPHGEVSGVRLFNLNVAAWGAAAETLQVDLIAKGWMTLYESLLQPSPCQELRWQADGPGTTGEIKRAYSALMGRFFGRGTLRVDHACCWLMQVQDGMELAPNVHLHRRKGSQYKGDLPDWVGWDVLAHGFVVAEAKGSRSASGWVKGTPAVVRDALEQVQRVEITDASGASIHAKTWVVASRWGTVENGFRPVLMTVDPDLDGRRLTEDELETIPREMHARWVASLLDGMGMRALATAIRKSQVSDTLDADLVRFGDRVGYAAVVTEGAGLLPLIGRGRAEIIETVRQSLGGSGEKAALLLLDAKTAQSALQRLGRYSAGFIDAAKEGGAITIDGFTLAPLSPTDWSLLAVD